MNTLRVGAFNTLNGFGHPKYDHTAETRATIEKMDADIIFLSELTDLEALDVDETSQKAKAIGKELGYKTLTSDYTPFDNVRNAQTQSMWVREARSGWFESPVRADRYTKEFSDDETGILFIGTHNNDNGGKASRDEAKAQLAGVKEHYGPAVIFGDLNAMRHEDPKSRLPRFGGLPLRFVEVKNRYDDTAKLQRALGKASRIARMADGRTMRIYQDAGLSSANYQNLTTFQNGSIKFTLDHVLMTPGVVSKHFETISDPNSDHKAIVADLERIA